MNLANIIHRKGKLRSTFVIAILLTSTLMSFVFFASAKTPPPIPGNEDYMTDFGVLHSDTYFLYPYETESLNIGFSKYGEMINLDEVVGLEYDGVDAFANPNVPMEEWSNGWIMNIHYTDQSILRNVWTYAMTTDFGDADGVGGPWRQMQQNIVPVQGVDDRGGRRTRGYAEADDIRLIYDGPRKAIYLLKTTIYDKNPNNPPPDEGHRLLS